ncbi:MAG: M20 family metallopeptidase [Chloroflexota bacterium]|nr:M20 family metallopeptidase [Chloroflexota bacterium]
METKTVDSDLVIELTRDLIRFPTVNPPGNELPAAEYLAQRMRDLGLEVEVQVLEDNRANVIGRLKGTGQGHLVFTGHIDVVPPGGTQWRYPPFQAEMVGDRIYGRGSADMKGGVAAIVTALAALAGSGFQPAADVIAAITYGEEAGMTGAKGMVAKRSLEGSRYLVVAEPSDLGVYIGEKGVLWIRVRARGRTAHGSMPHLGVNAVSYLARLIPELEAYPFPFQESELLGRPTLSVNVISGGNKTNVVPDLAEIEIDMRTVPGQNHQRMARQIRDMAEELGREFHPELSVEVEIAEEKGALETPADEPLVGAAVEAVAAVLGHRPEPGGVPYGTDAAYLGPGFAIPMVILGPGAAGMAHQPDEWVDTKQLVQAAEIYMDLARKLLG